MSGKSILSWQQYEDALDPLTKELSDAARWIQETGQRVVILFEGRDTAGKGGSIDMFARTLNPRQCKVVALSAPSKREQGQWYFQRYAEHFPSKGEITLFDRSWYNRAGVERVMGYCTEEQAQSFLRATPEFERHLVEDGMLLFKYWLCVDQDKQEKRFANRINNPRRRWKLSPIDLNREPLDALPKLARRCGRNPYRMGAVDPGRFQRPASRPADPAARPARPLARYQASDARHRLARIEPRTTQGEIRDIGADRQLSGGADRLIRTLAPAQDCPSFRTIRNCLGGQPCQRPD